MNAPIPLGLIGRGVLLMVVIGFAYVLAGIVFLNNASAANFPRQLSVLLLTITVAALTAGALWWRPRLLVLALVTFGATVVISHPGLQQFRLEVLATSVPVVREVEATDGSARCFCTTRRSLHELFGAPGFLAGGDRGSASIYAYERDTGGRHLVLYEFRTQNGAEDRVVAIRSEAFDPSRLGLRVY